MHRKHKKKNRNHFVAASLGFCVYRFDFSLLSIAFSVAKLTFLCMLNVADGASFTIN